MWASTVCWLSPNANDLSGCVGRGTEARAARWSHSRSSMIARISRISSDLILRDLVWSRLVSSGLLSSLGFDVGTSTRATLWGTNESNLDCIQFGAKRWNFPAFRWLQCSGLMARHCNGSCYQSIVTAPGSRSLSLKPIGGFDLLAGT